VSSSGIEALKDKNGPITWYAQRIIEQQSLVPNEKMMWTQTTREILDSQDLIVFMDKEHFDQATNLYRFGNKNYEIWGIEDVTGEASTTNVDSVIPQTEQIYNKIKIKVEDLIARNFKPQLPH
jgi:protein-tyrosine-phosphatase